MQPQYRPLVFPASEIKVRFRKYVPFFVHFLLTVSTAATILLYVNGRQFNLNSRNPSFIDSDGSISRVGHSYLLQSDVTTTVSLVASATRVAGGWWAGKLVWRCIFIFMEKGDISLKGLRQATQFPPLSLNGLGRKRDKAIISIVLIGTFAMDYFSSALTGSITWSQASTYVPGKFPITGINQTAEGVSLADYYAYPGSVTMTTAMGSAMASIAWTTSETAGISMTPTPIMKRVVYNAQYLSANSTVKNITLPYFQVHSFEWIQDANATLTDKQKSLLKYIYTDPSQIYHPYFAKAGKLGLIPDEQWGPLLNSTIKPESRIVSETRVLSYRISVSKQGTGDCSQLNTTEFGPQFQPYRVTTSIDSCFATAKVTYTAGAAICPNCRLASPGVFQSDEPLTPIPDVLTREALALAPQLGTYMLFARHTTPTTASAQDFSTEFLSRTYQVAWVALTDVNAPGTGQTETMISVLMSQASVVAWRVYLWLGLHVCMLLGGLYFAYLQSRCDHPWADDPVLAAFLLNKTDVMDNTLWDEVDPWKADEGDMPMGSLKLIGGGKGSSRYLALEAVRGE